MPHFDLHAMSEDELKAFKLTCRKALIHARGYQAQDTIHELYYHAEQERRIRLRREVMDGVNMQYKGPEYV